MTHTTFKRRIIALTRATLVPKTSVTRVEQKWNTHISRMQLRHKLPKDVFDNATNMENIIHLLPCTSPGHIRKYVRVKRSRHKRPMSPKNQPITLPIEYVTVLLESRRTFMNSSKPRRVQPIHVVIIFDVLLNQAGRLHISCHTSMVVQQRHISSEKPQHSRKITETLVLNVVSWSLITI